MSYHKLRTQINEDAKRLTVQDQYDLAASLAANCGYQLVVQDNGRREAIKDLIAYYKNLHPHGWETVIEGLESLLK